MAKWNTAFVGSALGLGGALLSSCGPEHGPRLEAIEGVASALGTPTRGDSIPIGIENVNDSPMKSASYRALLRFVPDTTVTIDRFYFGFKLRGASCWDAGNAGYGKGDGGTIEASLVEIDPATGRPGAVIVNETVNGCTRHDAASTEINGSDPVLVWVNTPATLEGGTMYGLVLRNAHADPAGNFYSFNMPLADTTLAGPHARNELDPRAPGAILALDPREHVAWSTDAGATWQYGSLNGQYRSYMNNHDTAHPATRMPQYGWRRADGVTVAQQPYYAYNDDCTGCTVTYANARYARTFTLVGGFIASGTDVGTLTFTNTSTGATSSCTPAQGYGFRTCTLPTPMPVAVGQSYTVHATGSVEIMRLDNPQRIMFPRVGTPNGELRWFQPSAAPSTNAKDVPNLWAGPVSAHFPAAGDPGLGDAGVVVDAGRRDGAEGAGGGADGAGGRAGAAGAAGLPGSGGAAGSSGGASTTAGASTSAAGGASSATTGSASTGAVGATTGGGGGAPGAGGGGTAGSRATREADQTGGCNCRMADARDARLPYWFALLVVALALVRRRSARDQGVW
jgi:MYXO-CTERM domain-containing protein